MTDKLIKTTTGNIPAQFKDKEAFKKMPKAELVKIIEDFVMPMSDPAKYKEMVKASVPELVKDMDDKEIMGQSMMQSGEEFLLAVVETLRKYNGFTDEKLSKFLKDLQGNLTVVEKIEEGGLSMLSDHSMRHIVDMVHELGFSEMLKRIAQTRYQKERTWKSGLEYPNVLEGSKIERKLQKPRR